jgi:hypothetical protein
MPDTFRVLAESNVGQTRALYERSKSTLQAVLESWQKTFGAVSQGAIALNRTMLDSAERNINAGFDLTTNLASARNLADIMELQAVYWRKVLGELKGGTKPQPLISVARSGDSGLSDTLSPLRRSTMVWPIRDEARAGPTRGALQGYAYPL